MKNGLVFFGAVLCVALGAACGAHPTSLGPGPGADSGCDSIGDPPGCGEGAHYDAASCKCVADNDRCADPGICGKGMHWDVSVCACEPDDIECGGICPIGSELNPQTCECVPLPDGGPPPACFIPNYGECAYGQTCVVAYCQDESPITCYCDWQGNTSCGGACEVDGGPPPPPFDGGPPDSGPQGCWLPGAGYCAPYTSCVTGYCPDHVTPISCYCEGNGVSQCTGACPPGPPPIDAGVGD